MNRTLPPGRVQDRGSADAHHRATKVPAIFVHVHGSKSEVKPPAPSPAILSSFLYLEAAVNGVEPTSALVSTYASV